MSSRNYFITGTDTDVGKTFVTGAMLAYLKRQDVSALGFKPISAGCAVTANGLENEDAKIIQRFSGVDVPLDVINPIAYEPPIAPHIAAQLQNETISFARLDKGWQALQQHHADIYFVEGAGGWFLPLNHQHSLNQWVEQQQFKVILVVGVKLGCLNHALLSAETIKAQGLELAGWVANIIDPNTAYIDENIATLSERLSAPLLAKIPFYEAFNDSCYEQISFSHLL